MKDNSKHQQIKTVMRGNCRSSQTQIQVTRNPRAKGLTASLTLKYNRLEIEFRGKIEKLNNGSGTQLRKG